MERRTDLSLQRNLEQLSIWMSDVYIYILLHTTYSRKDSSTSLGRCKDRQPSRTGSYLHPVGEIAMVPRVQHIPTGNAQIRVVPGLEDELIRGVQKE